LRIFNFTLAISVWQFLHVFKTDDVSAFGKLLVAEFSKSDTTHQTRKKLKIKAKSGTSW